MQLDLDALLNKVDSKYTLVVVAARRARQIVDAGGTSTLVASAMAKPVSIAFEEILQDKLEWEGPEEL